MPEEVVEISFFFLSNEAIFPSCSPCRKCHLFSDPVANAASLWVTSVSAQN